MQTYANWYRDQQGNAISGAQVTVFVANSSTLAAIYEPSASGSSLLTKSNPFTTDANGYFQFAAANGNYSIVLSGNSSSTTIIPYINLFDYGTTSAGGSGAAGAATQVQYSVGSGIFGASANFTFAPNVLTVGGTGTPNSFSSMKYFCYDTVNGVLQTNIQNKSAGASASADVVASADVSSDTTNFVNMGINSSGWSDATWTVNGANDAYFYGTGNVAVGTSGAAKQIVFFVGGTLAANIVSTVTSTTWTIPATVTFVPSGGIRYNFGATGSTNQDLLAKVKREMVSIYDFGGAGDNTTDNTTPLNNAVTYCNANNIGFILFPAGNYKFNSKPANFAQGVTLVGQGMQQTVMYRNYVPGSSTEGLFTWVGGGSTAGGGCRDLAILAINTGGAALAMTATAGVRPSGLSFKNLNITQNSGGDNWNYNIYCDGTAYTTAGSQGIRSVDVEDCILFACTTHNIYIANGVHWFVNNVGVYSAGGTVGSIRITGGGSANSNSTTCFFSNAEAIGTGLTMDNCDGISWNGYISGTGGLNVAATATNIVVRGVVASGGVTNASTSASIITNLAGVSTTSTAHTFGSTTTFTGTATFNGTLTANSIANIGPGGGGASNANVNINSGLTGAANLIYNQGGVQRWTAITTSGNTYTISAYDSGGTLVDSPISIPNASASAITLGGTTNRPVLSNGDLKVNTAGKGLFVKEGSNAKMGTATLVAGASTVSTTAVSATSRIFVTSNADGGTPGWLRVSARVAGTSFTITSSSGTDTSTVAWVIVDPA